MNKNTSWGGVSEWYDGLLEGSEGTYQREVILPNLLRLVGPQKGDRILDIACGQGFFARAFSGEGASVSGCDISKELIARAEEKEAGRKEKGGATQYHVASADKLEFAADASFDKAVIVLALQNIEDLNGAVAEAARVLKPGGSFHLALNHPSFRIPGRSDWGWDEKEAKQYRRLDAYMSDSAERIDMTPGEKDPKKKAFTLSFHRPLQVYFKAFTKNGLSVTRLEEWISHKKSQKGPRSAEEDRMRKEIPMFLYIGAKKG